jgi:ribonuclease D
VSDEATPYAPEELELLRTGANYRTRQNARWFATLQAHHDGSPSACARYRAALAEMEAAERAASQALRGLLESCCPSER